MEAIYTSTFIYIFISFIFHPLDHYRMIMDMSRDYNKYVKFKGYNVQHIFTTDVIIFI